MAKHKELIKAGLVLSPRRRELIDKCEIEGGILNLTLLRPHTSIVHNSKTLIACLQSNIFNHMFLGMVPVMAPRNYFGLPIHPYCLHYLGYMPTVIMVLRLPFHPRTGKEGIKKEE